MANLGEQIDADVAANKVVVYSKSWCPFCVQTKNLLNQKGIQFKLVELDQTGDGDEIQARLLGKTGQRTVPNIFIGGEHIGGNSELQALNADGQLDAKLAA